MKRLLPLLFLLLTSGQIQAQQQAYCTNNPERNWWDVLHYKLQLAIPAASTTLEGTVSIQARALHAGNRLLIDLQQPLHIRSVQLDNRTALQWVHKGNTCLVTWPDAIPQGDTFTLHIGYTGVPIQAQKAPWDGGQICTTDSSGHPWRAVACQGIGASVWFPCKDYPGDEPDFGADLFYTTEQTYTAIGNGRLMSKRDAGKGLTEWHWRVINPINLYDITYYVGRYSHWSSTYAGRSEPLSLDYYVLQG